MGGLVTPARNRSVELCLRGDFFQFTSRFRARVGTKPQDFAAATIWLSRSDKLLCHQVGWSNGGPLEIPVVRRDFQQSLVYTLIRFYSLPTLGSRAGKRFLAIDCYEDNRWLVRSTKRLRRSHRGTHRLSLLALARVSCGRKWELREVKAAGKEAHHHDSIYAPSGKPAAAQ